MFGPSPQGDNIYDPDYVADLFDRCSSHYRRWSAVSSFGFIVVWRSQCVGRLRGVGDDTSVAVDLMAGTGEIWPHLLRRYPKLGRIVAIDISKRMHLDAIDRIHAAHANRVEHIEANALETDLPENSADFLVSSFGLKTFNEAQQEILAQQVARILKPGGSFSMIEASDPKGWVLRPIYRFYLDHMLPLIERLFLKGAQDFSMIGTYTRNFGDCASMERALKDAGLSVTMKRHFFGCATSVAGHKPNECE